jgi:prepilin-type N-terminal cleavage/methylation domain-containing protein
MKRSYAKQQSGYTLVEMMVALGIGATILGVILTASVALQKTFNAVDHFFATHMQQIRIIDYLNRDAKRAYIVTTSPDLKTVTMTIPKYIIESGDSEAVSNPSLVGTVRTPTISYTSGGSQVNYGTTTSTVVYSINGNTIQRTEDGVVTVIASSTDQLVDQATDVELANTEYTSTSVTFMPLFTSSNTSAERSGTTVYSLSYLRNKRRG